MRGELENHSVPSRQRSGQRATQNTQCKHQSSLIMPLNITLICNFMTENTPELFYNRALFPRATRAAGTCRAAGSVSAGCICKHETIITQVSDPQFSSESKMLCWWCLAMGKKKTRLTRKTRAVCNCYMSSLVSQDSESVVAGRWSTSLY